MLHRIAKRAATAAGILAANGVLLFLLVGGFIFR